MELHLRNKVIIVTGGASGIGAAICESLHLEGAVPFIIDKKAGKYYTVLTELTDAQACKQTIEMIGAIQGRIDGIVYNAGLYQELVAETLPWLEKTKGAIVNIISKAAVTGLPRVWADELRVSGIRFNGVMVTECYTPDRTNTKEIADTVVYLLSRNSAALNGELVFADGDYAHIDKQN